ncbi:hypothetical protein SAMN04488029_2705 [Reichenbachiella faecimaris]|uniref:Helix-turn-helix domain-containing protein n=1 Tax=Reichenbachiella faecimaris TaxID=692418 RepID=A0A1W2GHD4_REIFA|nr:helix-turn-helix domain-containing protein [Reichenbachiella faecimaris]SMD36083.1 hypothetical protein SAMN04488029_2705 [Reichenbachiella faecimaris]
MRTFNETLAKVVQDAVAPELNQIQSSIDKLVEEFKKVSKSKIDLPCDPEIVYLPEAAKILKCSKWTVVRLEKRGFFARLNKIPKSPIYYRKSDIINFLSSNDN